MGRWTLFLVGVAASVAVTAILWLNGIPGGAFLLLFPFAFWPRGEVARCPCGKALAPDDRFCSRCGRERAGARPPA